MSKEVSPAGIPTEIKGKDAIGYENVVAGMAFARNDSLGAKNQQEVQLQDRCPPRYDMRRVRRKCGQAAATGAAGLA
jgi:hypothetical protein